MTKYDNSAATVHNDNAVYILHCCENRYPIPDLPNCLSLECKHCDFAFEEISINAFKTEKDAIDALILIAENEYPGNHFTSVEDITSFLKTIAQNGDDVLCFELIKISNKEI